MGQVLHTSLCPGAVPRCNPPPQSMSPAYLPSQKPAAPRGFSEGGDLHLQGWLRAGTLTLGAESCFLVFSHLFPPGTAVGTVFPAVGRGQLLVTAIPQGCREDPVGAGPRPGQQAWPRGGRGQQAHGSQPYWDKECKRPGFAAGTNSLSWPCCCPAWSWGTGKQPAWHPAPPAPSWGRHCHRTAAWQMATSWGWPLAWPHPALTFLPQPAWA